ncbi:MAG TPA: hypothetical protein PLD19_06095 [Luteimonas sp.]|nr:hypothetical protein [Luteimonas sp.]
MLQRVVWNMPNADPLGVLVHVNGFDARERPFVPVVHARRCMLAGMPGKSTGAHGEKTRAPMEGSLPWMPPVAG